MQACSVAPGRRSSWTRNRRTATAPDAAAFTKQGKSRLRHVAGLRLLLPDTCGHEAVLASYARASTNAGLDPRGSMHLLVARLFANANVGRAAALRGIATIPIVGRDAGRTGPARSPRRRCSRRRPGGSEANAIVRESRGFRAEGVDGGRWEDARPAAKAGGRGLPFGAAGVPQARAVYCFSAIRVCPRRRSAAPAVLEDRHVGAGSRLRRCRSQRSSVDKWPWAGCQRASRRFGVLACGQVSVRIRVGLIGRRLLCKSVCAHEP
jgi:hypothetical protein